MVRSRVCLVAGAESNLVWYCRHAGRGGTITMIV
jgi:hypothetical protein